MKNSLEGFTKRVEQAKNEQKESVSLKINQLRNRKKNEEKLADPQRPMGHLQAYQHMYTGALRRGKKVLERICEDRMAKNIKFDEKH